MSYATKLPDGCMTVWSKNPKRLAERVRYVVRSCGGVLLCTCPGFNAPKSDGTCTHTEDVHALEMNGHLTVIDRKIRVVIPSAA